MSYFIAQGNFQAMVQGQVEVEEPRECHGRITELLIKEESKLQATADGRQTFLWDLSQPCKEANAQEVYQHGAERSVSDEKMQVSTEVEEQSQG